MASPGEIPDEPLTPAGRLFLRPELNTIIHCVIGTEDPLDVDTIKLVIESSFMLQHPRFNSLMVRDRNGVEHWRRIPTVDLNRHIIVVHEKIDDIEDDTTAANQYVADLSVSCPLAVDKPLWEVHVLKAHRCIVLRLHHALGDGVSMMSMLVETTCKSKRGTDGPPNMILPTQNKESRRRKTLIGRVGWLMKSIWFSLVFILDLILRCLWVSDRRNAISGGEGVELWPRKLATARFMIDDMKLVKSSIPNGTINDVLFAVITSGLSTYLDSRSPNGLQKEIRLTGVAMVNLRQQQKPGLQELSDLMKGNTRSRWGNKFGMFLLPVYCRKSENDPLQYLKRSKTMLDRKKQSLEAHFAYKIGDFIMSLLGPKCASWLNYRIICNTSFTISNVVGPQEEITIVDNPVTYLRGTTSSLPHALTMHMVSYAGKADLQLLVAKNIIPDPEFLAKCFENSLQEMKKAVVENKD